jgi:hypothetical protein
MIDEQTLLASIPEAMQREYDRCGELINTVILNDLDPENLNGDAHRMAQRERVFE